MAKLAWEPVWQGEEAGVEIVRAGLERAGVPARSQGLTTVAGGFPAAFARNTWAVFVPSRDAARARAYLERTGETRGIVTGEESGPGLTAMQKDTLRFVIAGLLIFVIIALLAAIKAAAAG